MVSFTAFVVVLHFQTVAVGYAIMTARTAEDWKIRAFRVLPMFLLPALSSLTYSAIRSFVNMCKCQYLEMRHHVRYIQHVLS